jgi:hypothetical protein
VLRTHEWAAAVGDRADGKRTVGTANATVEFSFRLNWKDAFGGRLSSEPVLRAEFVRKGARWTMSS